MAHYTNIAVQTLSNLPLVPHIENLLRCLYAYFNHVLKMHLEFTKWAWIMEIKSNKILGDIKITDLYDQSYQMCLVYVLHEMALDAPTIPSAKSNLYLLIDVETLLGLNVVM
jgi:hypothetical protein